MKKSILFLDRDGTLIIEPPNDYQVDSLEKLAYLPDVTECLQNILKLHPYELVMVTNQDGLGTDSFPEETFWPAHNAMMEHFKKNNIHFSDVLIDRSFEYENKPTRKPNIGLCKNYIDNDAYDLTSSFVVGDRLTDIMLAKNLNCQGIWIKEKSPAATAQIQDHDLQKSLGIQAPDWKSIENFFQEQHS